MMSSTATPRMRYHHHQPQRHRSPHFYLKQQICHPQPARGRVTTVACCCVGVCCVAHFSLSDTSRRAAVSVMSAFGSTQTPTTTTTGTGTGTTGGGGALVGGGVNSGGISRGSAMGGVGGGIGGVGGGRGRSGWRNSLNNRRDSVVAPRAAAASEVVTTLNEILGDGVTRDAGAAVAAALGAYLWVKMFDILASKNMLERKLSRKLIHTSCGPFFMLTWPLFSSAPEAKFFAAAVPLLQGIRLAAIGSGVVKNENAVRAVSREGDRSELLRGPLFYTGVMVVTTALFWRSSPSGVAALSLMCGGDGLADIVGRRLGKGNKLWFNENKSAAGSAAMFIGGFGLSMGLTALFHSLGYLELTAWAAAWRLAVVAAACTLVEALPITRFVDDNISVPVLAIVLGGVLFQ